MRSTLAMILGASFLFAPPAWARSDLDPEPAAEPAVAAPAAEPEPPWNLSRREPGEPRWAPLLRTRAHASDYEGTRWESAYTQILAQAEAALGHHAAALRAWDSLMGGPDSVGTLPDDLRAIDAIEYLADVADTARVIMINERHHAASDRLLTLELLPILQEKGYRYLAAEAFSHDDSTLATRGYPTDGTGTYTGEPVFAAVVREALRLGYRLVPYESRPDQTDTDDDLTPQARRDRAQAENLAHAIFDADPEARVLVHAGFSHILERETERWYPMALYLREMTGIDPVTVDQTRLSERSDAAHEHPAYRAALAAGLLDGGPVVLVEADGRPYAPADFAVDLQVFTPRTTYTNGRPDWMTLGGRRRALDVDVPGCRDRTCILRARVDGEPDEAVPLDWAEADGESAARLFVPSDTPVVIEVFDAAGERLRAIDVAPGVAVDPG